MSAPLEASSSRRRRFLLGVEQVEQSVRYHRQEDCWIPLCLRGAVALPFLIRGESSQTGGLVWTRLRFEADNALRVIPACRIGPV
jgi:hypothetical protein